MTELICDICGTSYPDTASKCPTCGYGRAFEAPSGGADAERTEYEKIPGGRFSRKNVQKRLSEQAEPEEEIPVQEEKAEEPVAPPPEPEAPQLDEAAMKAYRKEIGLNMALAAAIVTVLLTGGYLLICYGIPYLQTLIG